MQVSLAELKQEVNAAKSLSTSASVVLQTNANLKEAQHKLLTPPSPTVQSTRSTLKLEDAKQVPEIELPITCGRPAPVDKAPKPELLQWLATGVSQPNPAHSLTPSIQGA